MIKKLLLLGLAFGTLANISYAQTSSSTFLTYINRIANWSNPVGIAAGMAVPGYASSTPYSLIALSFWLASAPAGPAEVWNNPVKYFGTTSAFGSTNDEIRTTLLSAYHGAGKKVIVSAFGSTETPTTAGADATTTCTNLANWAKTTRIDGIDIDYEDSQAFINGTAEAWLIACTNSIRSIMPTGTLLIHSPVAPYFSGKNIYPAGGYTYIDQQVGSKIDYYNVQFYNQGSTSYDSYIGLFTTSGGYFPGTSLKEIADKGVPISKIILGKPASTADVMNTGYVPASTLAGWITQFRSAYPTYSWKTGASTWQYSSDNTGAFISPIAQSLSGTPPSDTQSPTAPGNLTATPGSSSQINLAWTASTDNVSVSGYYIYKGGVLITSTSGTTYSDTGLAPSTSYSYSVKAFDGAGNISSSSAQVSAITQALTDTTPPAQISDLATTTLTQTSATLSFTSPGDNGSIGTAASYDIRYSTKSITKQNFNKATQVSGEPTPMVAGTKQTYILAGLRAGGTYYVAMTAKDSAGNISPMSNVILFKTPTTGPIADASLPTALTSNPHTKHIAHVEPFKPKLVMEEPTYTGELINLIKSPFSVFTPIVNVTKSWAANR